MFERRALIALVAGCLVAASGCGTASEDSSKDFKGEQAAVASAVEDLQEAGRDGDAGKICSKLLTKDVVARIKAAGARSCEKTLDDSLDDADTYELTVKKVAIDGNRATAVVKSEAGDEDRSDTLELVKEGGRWKLAAIGG